MAEMPVHHSEFVIHADLETVFAFFSDASNLERITPPELSFRIVTPLPIEMKAGTRIEYKLSLSGIPFRWRTLIPIWEPPHRFMDLQEKGPYAKWEHEHRFTQLPDGVLMEDTVRYEVPFGLLGKLALPFVRAKVRRIFEHRNRTIGELFASQDLGKET